jgi:hypothetical protein
MRWVEERRYVNAPPRAVGAVFTDVEVETGGVRVTGVAEYGRYVVVRYVRGDAVVYAFYEPRGAVGGGGLADAGLLRRLVALDWEDGVRRAMVAELREFADMVEGRLRGLPVEVVATMSGRRSLGHVEVRLARRVDADAFRRYADACRSLGMVFDRASRAWVYVPPWSQYPAVAHCGARNC